MKRAVAPCLAAWTTAAALGCGGPPTSSDAATARVEPKPEAPAAKPVATKQPAAPPKPARVTLAAGDDHTCALVRPPGAGGDRVKCWGSNEDGALGLGDEQERGLKRGQMGDKLPFVELDGEPAPFVSIAAAGRRSCALRGDGKLFCWGDNGMGQLGLGDERPRGGKPEEVGPALPAVDLPGPVVAVALGSFHSCALLESGDVACWGGNQDGQLGLGDRERRGDGPGELGAKLPLVSLGTDVRVRALAAGSSHTCALFAGAPELVKCWGGGHLGELGLADTENRGDRPGQMGDALPGVDLGRGFAIESLSLGALHACAVSTDHRVKCWGGNKVGQLGAGHRNSPGRKPGEDSAARSMGDALPFVDLGADANVVAVAAGNSHTCAIVRRKDDVPGIKCWGMGPLGIGSEGERGTSPGEMGDALPFVDLGKDLVPVALASGGSHTCALLVEEADAGAATGRVKCWGRNEKGTLGLGDPNDRGYAPGEMGDKLPFVDLGEGVRVVAPG